MKLDSAYDEVTRACRVNMEVGVSDILQARNTEQVKTEIIYQLAAAVVGKIMEKVGPVIDGAFKEVAE